METKHLKLTHEDLTPAAQKDKKVLANPKFFHFSAKFKPIQFHEADLITFTGPDGVVLILKDRYGKGIPA